MPKVTKQQVFDQYSSVYLRQFAEAQFFAGVKSSEYEYALRELGVGAARLNGRNFSLSGVALARNGVLLDPDNPENRITNLPVKITQASLAIEDDYPVQSRDYSPRISIIAEQIEPHTRAVVVPRVVVCGDIYPRGLALSPLE